MDKSSKGRTAASQGGYTRTAVHDCYNNAELLNENRTLEAPPLHLMPPVRENLADVCNQTSIDRNCCGETCDDIYLPLPSVCHSTVESVRRPDRKPHRDHLKNYNTNHDRGRIKNEDIDFDKVYNYSMKSFRNSTDKRDYNMPSESDSQSDECYSELRCRRCPA